MKKRWKKIIMEERYEDGTQRKRVYYRDEMGRMWSRLEIAGEIIKTIGMATIMLGAFMNLLCLFALSLGLLYMLFTT